MKKLTAAMICVLILFAAASLAEAKIPMSLLGIELGGDINNYQDLLRAGSTGLAEDYPYLNEVTIPPGKIPGIRLGVIAYGGCANPGRIVRIKLKLSQPSRNFYKRLLALYKKKLGDPQQYRGDPFQNRIAWKWSFVENDSRVSLIISNSRDPEESPGNQIKITLQNLMGQERQCWQQKHPPRTGGQGTGGEAPFDIMELVPK